MKACHQSVTCLVFCCLDALREGAHRLLKALGCVNEASHSPLVQPQSQGDEDTANAVPPASQTLPLKVNC